MNTIDMKKVMYAVCFVFFTITFGCSVYKLQKCIDTISFTEGSKLILRCVCEGLASIHCSKRVMYYIRSWVMEKKNKRNFVIVEMK